MRFLTFFIIIFSLFLFSFGKKQERVPENILTEEKMVDVMVDMHLVETASNLKLLPLDSTDLPYREYFASVFVTHGVSKAEFDSSMFHYTTHTEQMNAIYDKVLERLNQMEAEISPGR